jgi:uncharacterized RDD family membrane protein YckC
VLFGAFFFLCDFFSSVPGMSGRPDLFQWTPASNRSHRAATEGKHVLSKSASLPAQPFDAFDPPSNETAATPAWKQEVNQRLAAHRNRRGGPQDAPGDRAAGNPRAASARATEAAARVAARYAKAPSYSELLAGEARAVVRAAGQAAEAARNAQAAAQAVLAGLESGPIASGRWEPDQEVSYRELQQAPPSPVQQAAAPPRWQDEPPQPPSAPTHGYAMEPEAEVRSGTRAGAQPHWEEALPVALSAPQLGRDVWSEMRGYRASETDHRSASERHYGQRYGQGVEEGELFPEESSEYSGSLDSHDLLLGATVEPVQHLPANLIEFPRELVATRKARPRLAEGPYYNASHEGAQLSIFEVDPELLAPAVYASDAAVEAVAPPEWASIELDHLEQHREHHSADHADSRQVYLGSNYAAQVQTGAADVDRMSARVLEELPVAAVSTPVANAPFASYVAGATRTQGSQVRNEVIAPKTAPAAELIVAPLSDRLLAAVVDGALVTLALAIASVVVIAATAHPPTGRIALIASGCGLLLFGLLYQFLFLSYAEEGTLGMRYARIALCTFDDDNPTMDQMRQRIPAQFLSVLPAGLGLIWALFDKDHLGWHDRITRTYQRKY